MMQFSITPKDIRDYLWRGDEYNAHAFHVLCEETNGINIFDNVMDSDSDLISLISAIQLNKVLLFK